MMLHIINRLLLIKGYSQDVINNCLAQVPDENKVNFLNQYLDNVERTIAYKLSKLCVDENTFYQWMNYVAQCKSTQTNEQILTILEQYVPESKLELVQTDQSQPQAPVQQEVQQQVQEQPKEQPQQQAQVQQEVQQEVQQPQQEQPKEQPQQEVQQPQQEVQQQVQEQPKEQNNLVQNPSSDSKELAEQIRTKRKEIDTLIHDCSLLIDKTKIGPFMNDNHLNCPSYHKLMPEIKNAIANKRRQSINKFWYEKYRPELVEEIIFPNQVLKEQITAFVEKGIISGNCMFYGRGGVGKTTTNIVLMNSVLKHINDRHVLGKGVSAIEDLKGWLNAKPYGEQKIVIAEEFDRLSDAAQTELKNGLMEKYNNVVFLASSNKLHKIDSALLTRFTLVAKMDTIDLEGLYKKLEFILTNERQQFTKEDLDQFINTHKLKGIRSILNLLQLSCYLNVFDPNRTSMFIGNSGAEYELIGMAKWYFNALQALPKQDLVNLTYNLNYNQDINNVRSQMTYILNSNHSINLEFIYEELIMDPAIYLPTRNLIEKFYQDSELKKIPVMHFETMLNEIILDLIKSKDIYVA